jgi:mono/diheme cytochrome c family protein
MRYAGMPAFPAIASAGFLELASDEFIASTIARGRPGRRMPAWGGAHGTLDDTEIEGLVGYLRRLGRVSQPTPVPPVALENVQLEQGAVLYAAACGGCHGMSGEGAEGPALANAVFLDTASNAYIAETIRRGRPGTSMEAFGRPSVTRPTLSRDEIASIVAHIRSWEVAP